MWLTRLTSHFAKATRLAGCLVPRICSAFKSHGSLSAGYSSYLSQKQHVPSQNWISLEPELDEMLVPRMMSISPLESLLSSRYSLPKSEIHKQEDPLEHTNSYECPPNHDANDLEKNREENNIVQCKNVLKIRRRKMNKHKYKKLQKRMKFVKRKIMDGRRRRKQVRFERDLKRIWMKAGLKKAPDGWQAPKIYVKH
ncbi:hypothetical protein GDO86_012653 [Hymenochirus boettgeri]|uniref:Small ribosomal subunit protein mS38 n=1 Tax=Hymenochirus boettgeri TaxID=247094 RepID=A0A8T2IQU2_9PIPI|nr:hypothetical protein GDO86_012653 [Hymenochirus boettgeri]KAG8434353.1 hypothetical protein GDO86_012653 [Hymenochirus boettgeri]